MEKIKTSKYNKWLALMSGIVLVGSQGVKFYFLENNISMWDFEGFQWASNSQFLLGIVAIIYGLYLFYKKDMLKRNPKTQYSILVFMLFFGIGGLIMVLSKNDFKYQLPLKKIETTQIEGTLKRSAKFTNNIKTSMIFASIGELKEFPNITFDLPWDLYLKSEMVNIPWNESDKITYPEGSKVKLKIRTDDYQQLMALIESGENLKTLPTGKLDRRRIVSFYEFEINDEVIIRKFGIK